jgi:hypothetical protein
MDDDRDGDDYNIQDLTDTLSLLPVGVLPQTPIALVITKEDGKVLDWFTFR